MPVHNFCENEEKNGFKVNFILYNTVNPDSVFLSYIFLNFYFILFCCCKTFFINLSLPLVGCWWCYCLCPHCFNRVRFLIVLFAYIYFCCLLSFYQIFMSANIIERESSGAQQNMCCTITLIFFLLPFCCLNVNGLYIQNIGELIRA